MPQICYFYGITIYIHFLDHNPPHIHCAYQGYRAMYEISSGKLLAGKMPNKADKLLYEWIKARNIDLLKVWELASNGQQVFPLLPLE